MADRKITAIPPDFEARDMGNTLDEYYPNGINHSTRVSVVINCSGKLFLYEDHAAQCFGWKKCATPSSVPGFLPEEAPVTHYKILRAE